MRVGVYPGSFDPMTLGHLDIIERGCKVVDKLIVAVLNNGAKNPMFSTEERVEFLRIGTKHLDNVEICAFDGLLVDFVRQKQAQVVIRGLRAVTDFEYELQMAQANRSMLPTMETIFLTTKAEYSYVSSSIVKDVLRHGGEVGQFVPSTIVQALYARKNQPSSDR
jgi:pantetheine-phosphate adenylyltransferase